MAENFHTNPEAAVRNLFNKSERLRHRKNIKRLFEHGRWCDFAVIRMVHVSVIPKEVKVSHQVLFTISKKLSLNACHRNTLKRRMREAYRVSKSLLCDIKSVRLLIGYVYVGNNKNSNYRTINQSIHASIEHLNSLYTNTVIC